jgi:HEAT repeat protein
MSADSPRPVTAPRNAVAALALLLWLAAAAPAQFPEPTPYGPFNQRPVSKRVEKVRQALQSFGSDPKAAQEELNEHAKALSGLTDLGEALVLPEWGWRQPGGEGPDPKGRDDVARRFKETLDDALTRGDATRQCAAATLFAELSSADSDGRRGGLPDPFVFRFFTGLLPAVAGLANSKDADVREALARALGRATLDAEQVIDKLDKLLADSKDSVRQAAARALVYHARVGHAPRGEAFNRPEPPSLAACAAVVRVAAKGAADKDDEVSGPCVGAIRQAAGATNTVASYLQGQVGMLRATRPPSPRAPRPPGAGEGEALANALQILVPVAGALGEGVPSLLPLLKSEIAARRVRGCQALEAVAELRARMLVVAGDGAALALALGKADPLLAGLQGALPDLTRCAEDKDVEVRLAALYALEELGPEAAPAAKATEKAMDHPDPFVRWAAARVFGKMALKEPKTAVRALAGRVDDENGDVRITALAALERYGRAAAPEVKRVCQVLKNKKNDEQTRLWALRVLAAAGSEGREEATRPLIEALSPKEAAAVRRAAIRALAGYGKPDADTTAALRAALKDDDDEVRRGASEALLAEN